MESIGPRIKRFRFVSTLLIVSVLGFLSAGTLAGAIRSPLRDLPSLFVAVAMGATAILTFVRMPRSLAVHEGGLVVARGVRGEIVPWSDLRKIVVGPVIDGRRGMRVLYGAGRKVELYRANVGRRRMGEIARAIKGRCPSDVPWVGPAA